MRWERTWRADPRAATLADGHYSRKSPGTDQFAPPGRCLPLITCCDEAPGADALWVSTAQRLEYNAHAFGDVWICTIFRNVGRHLSSELIVEATAATRARWGDPPPGGWITFVDARKIRSQNPGYCFACAGWTKLRERTKDRGLIVYHLAPELHPPPEPALLAPRVSGQLALKGT